MGHQNPGMLSKEGHQQAMALGERQHATFSKAAAPSHGEPRRSYAGNPAEVRRQILINV